MHIASLYCTVTRDTLTGTSATDASDVGASASSEALTKASGSREELGASPTKGEKADGKAKPWFNRDERIMKFSRPMVKFTGRLFDLTKAPDLAGRRGFSRSMAKFGGRTIDLTIDGVTVVKRARLKR